MFEDRRTRLKRWLESEEIKLQPLTFPQRELWEASPIPASHPSNHICAFIEVRGLLAPEDCEAATQRVVDRQEVMRLSLLPGKDQPVQMIRARARAAIRFAQFPAADCRREGLENAMQEVFHEPFDMVQGPLYRVKVLRRSADDQLLILSIHHAIADGWSLGAFVHDLCEAYARGRMGVAGGLPPPRLSYSGWGSAERAFWQPEVIEQRLPFWRSFLAGGQRLWTAPVNPRAMENPLQKWVSRVSPELGSASREFARNQGATLFTVLLTAFRIALARWGGAPDVVVGSPVANRNKQGVGETMGYFSGVVPLRQSIAREESFSENLGRVHQASVDAFANTIPFAELVRGLKDPPSPGHTPVFDVRFALQNHPVPSAMVPGLAVRLKMCSTGTARFHLGCEITEEGQALEVVWLFRESLFSQAEIQKLGYLFEAILALACRSPNSRKATFAI